MTLLDADSIANDELQNGSELDPPIMLKKMDIQPGHVDLILQHPAFAVIVEEMVSYFVKSGAQNYQELTFQHEEFGKFTLLIQKQNGHTPGYINRILREALEEIIKLEAVDSDQGNMIAQNAFKKVGYLDA